MQTVAMDDIIDAQAVGETLGWTMDKVYRFTREGRIPVAKRFGTERRPFYLYLKSEVSKCRK